MPQLDYLEKHAVLQQAETSLLLASGALDDTISDLDDDGPRHLVHELQQASELLDSIHREMTDQLTCLQRGYR